MLRHSVLAAVPTMNPRTTPEAVSIQASAVKLHGLLRLPPDASSVILFAHGSGSGRLSPCNNFVAERLKQAGITTRLLDLLTAKEEEVDAVTAELRFDIPLLTTRLAAATEWALRQQPLRRLAVGYFGASTGSQAPLARVRAATLLIVGGNDPQVLALNQEALRELRCEKELAVVPGATHLFAEAGALEQVTTLATAWFTRHARPRGAASPAVSGPE
jgi:putative phosphoribosyl transferase